MKRVRALPMGCAESVPDSDSDSEDEEPRKQPVTKGKGSVVKPTPGAAPGAADGDDAAAAVTSSGRHKAKSKKLQWDLPEGTDEDGLETLDLDEPNPAGNGNATIAHAAALADEVGSLQSTAHACRL